MPRDANGVMRNIECGQITGVRHGSNDMRILVTGSSGWLGQTLVPRLRRDGHEVVGIDPIPSENTDVVGSIVNRQLISAAIRDFEIRAIVHSGGLHKPNIETRVPTSLRSTCRARSIYWRNRYYRIQRSIVSFSLRQPP